MNDPNDPDLVGRLKERFLEGTNDPIVILNHLLIVRWANSAAINLLGDHAVVGRTWNLTPEAAAESWPLISAARRAADTGSSYMGTLSKPDSVWRFMVIPLRVEAEGTIGVGIHLHNIRELAIAAGHTGQAPTEWRRLFEAVDHPTFVLDTEQRIISANASAVSLLRASSEEELIGHHCYELFHHTDSPPEGCPAAALIASTSPEPQSAEMTALGRVFSVSTSPLFDASGKLWRVIHVATDVTEEKRAWDAAQLYLDILAHDVANYLQAIVFATSSMQQSDNHMRESLVNMVFDSVDRITHLIARARAIEGLETSPLTETVLQDVLTELAEQIRNEHPEVEVKSSLPPVACVVLASEYVRDLFECILENAIRHNLGEDKRVWISLKAVAGGFEVTVADNGPGLTQSEKKSLLNGTRRFGGVGIHQAKIIARRYGATIVIRDRVDEDPQYGAEFAIWFPRPPSLRTEAT